MDNAIFNRLETDLFLFGQNGGYISKFLKFV